MAHIPVSLDDSITRIISRIDGAMSERSSGKFWNFNNREPLGYRFG